jgi:hypothetical protein
VHACNVSMDARCARIRALVERFVSKRLAVVERYKVFLSAPFVVETVEFNGTVRFEYVVERRSLNGTGFDGMWIATMDAV